MKRLKRETVNCYGKIFFIVLMTLTYGCKDNSNSKSIENLNTYQQDSLSKQDFIECSNLTDTIFPNDDYLKVIPIDNSNYTIEIKIEEVIDTLDFYLSCKTSNGMIPKLLLASNSICFLQGSTSYRYLTLCSLDDDNKNINIDKFETAINVSSKKDGFLFAHENNLFFYDRTKEQLLSKKISNQSLKIKHAELLDENKTLITYEEGSTFTYNLNEFH